MAVAILLSLFIVVFSIWHTWRKRKVSLFKDLGIPGPAPNIISGNLGDFVKKKPIQCFEDWTREHGDIVGYYFGDIPVLLIKDVELLQKIQVEDASNFVDRCLFLRRYNCANPALHYNLITLQGERWKVIRNLLVPALTSKRINQLYPVLEKSFQEFMKNVDQFVQSHEEFEVGLYIQRLTADILVHTLFGVESCIQKDTSDPFINHTQETLRKLFTNPLLIPYVCFPEMRFFLYVLERMMKSMYCFLHGVPLSKLLAKCEELMSKRKVFTNVTHNDILQLTLEAESPLQDVNNISLSALTAGKECKPSSGLSASSIYSKRILMPEEIAPNLVGFLYAGFNAISSAASIAMHVLAQYPKVQQRLQNELTEAGFKKAFADCEILSQLPYLHQVYCELLRLYPPVVL